MHLAFIPPLPTATATEAEEEGELWTCLSAFSGTYMMHYVSNRAESIPEGMGFRIDSAFGDIRIVHAPPFPLSFFFVLSCRRRVRFCARAD